MEFKTCQNYMRYHTKYDSIISSTLSLFHASKNYAFLLMTITCKSELISPIEAWSKAAEDLDTLNDALSKHPNYVYSIGVIEPHINAGKLMPSYDGLIENNENPKVEVERFFTHKIPVTDGQSAKDAFGKINSAIAEYQKTLPEGQDIYQLLRYYYPSKQKRTHYGYPRFLIVLCVSTDKIVNNRFPSLNIFYDFIQPQVPYYLIKKNSKSGRHSQTYSKESTMTTRYINDTKILLFALKNTTQMTHDNLVGRCPIKLYNTPIEIISIFKALNSKFGHEVDYGDLDKDQEYKKIVIGSGDNPPTSDYFPIITPLSKTHNCIIIIVNFMRKYKIYFDEDNSMFYKHVEGSFQTYYKYGDIQVLLNGVSSEYPDKIDLLKINSPYIRKCSASKESFFDKIIMSNKWVEYNDFCFNLVCGLATPKDGRYPCFSFYPEVKYSDKLWTCESMPQMWLKFLMDLKIVKYDFENVGRLNVALPHLLNRFYEIVIPRNDNSIRNLSVNDERIFSLLLTPFFSLYKDAICYDNLANYDKNAAEQCQLVVIINPKLSKKFNLDKMCNIGITKHGTRTVIVDTVTKSLYPYWAYLGSLDDCKLHSNFNNAFDRLTLEDSYLTTKHIDNISSIRHSFYKESGSIFIHLATTFFHELGGIVFLKDAIEIDAYIAKERARDHILERNKVKYLNTPRENKDSSSLGIIPILSREELLKLKEQEESTTSNDNPDRSSGYIDKVFANIEWPSFSRNSLIPGSPLIKNNIQNTFSQMPDFPF